MPLLQPSLPTNRDFVGQLLALPQGPPRPMAPKSSS
jgi:hypothetical protein